MDIKFFARDVIGAQPTKPGDSFEAIFFGELHTFKVTELVNGCIFAELFL